MSVLVVGISHKTAPVQLLERLALDSEGLDKLLVSLTEADHVREAAVIATCNRLEVYTDVDRFHGSVEEVSARISELAGDAADTVLPHLYVHYEDAAVSQLFHVAAGLDSLALGEAQILGQTRAALATAQRADTAGPALNALFQQALRVGKRAHAETDIDHAAPSLVRAALEECSRLVGPVAGRTVVVIGAGSMAALSLANLERLGAADVTLVNRTADNAAVLAAEYAATTRPRSELDEALATADLLIACTGAPEVLVTADQLRAVRRGGERPLAIIDLALPHDVDTDVTELPGVTLVNLSTLAVTLGATEAGREVDEVRRIVLEEVAAFLSARAAASVTPTVVALRTMATDVVEAEVARLDARLPDLDPAAREELVRTVRRVADKLLHQPTVRVRELAGETGAVSYAAALADLFSLDPESVDAVTRPALGQQVAEQVTEVDPT